MHNKPLIFDIVNGSYVDGPGFRTVVFLKGCPLKCSWCHNPESQGAQQESYYYSDKCQHCKLCEENHCMHGAQKNVGNYYPPDDLVDVILKNREYYAENGGVTFSGGEPLMWPKYLTEVCSTLKKNGIHITIDTCGHFDYEGCEDLLLNYVDLVLYDLKIMDSVQHVAYTGADNSLILSNFERLYNEQVLLQPVVPLIPVITANKGNIKAIAEFLAPFGLPSPVFHPFHSTANEKLIALRKLDTISTPANPLSLGEQKRWEFYYKLKFKQCQAVPSV